MATPRQNSVDVGTEQVASQQVPFENAKIIEERNSKTNEVKRYTKGKFLGKGGFAKCYEFTSIESKQLLASKVIPKATLNKSRAKQKLMSEIKIHRSLNHPNVVGFEHFFEDYENVYILLEMCSNQTMNELIRRRKRLTEIEVQCYLVQILSALKYLHKHRVIHRDLKLGNLFLSDKMEIKLGDFGLATRLEYDGERKRTICGTPNYIAPEILEGKRGHSYEVDVWSLGVIMYTLLIGKPPFETNDVKTTYRRIKMNAYSFPEHVIISVQAKDLITKILNNDPAKRPTLDEILSHEFLNNGGTIPKLLPVSTLACPPSTAYLRQFLPSSRDQSTGRQVSPKRMESTAPNPHKQPFLKERKDFINTDRALSSGISGGPVGQVGGNNVNFDVNNINNNHIKEEGENINLVGYNTRTNENMQQVLKTSVDKFSYNKRETEKLATTGGGLQDQQDIWVKKWVDYSQKYGLGYLLNNGAAGAFFNDSTKIILEPNGEKFDYIERKGTEKEDVVSKYTLSDFPKDLQKKITLLQHFKNYLDQNDQKKDGTQTQFNPSTYVPAIQNQNPLGSYQSIPMKGEQQQNIYVKKWLRTKHAILFRLSNKVVQVIFQDQTEIILSSELKIVTYVNKKHERLTYPLANALESSNQEMSKRLKYTKDILTHMLGNGQQQQQQQQQVQMQGSSQQLGVSSSTSSSNQIISGSGTTGISSTITTNSTNNLQSTATSSNNNLGITGSAQDKQQRINKHQDLKVQPTSLSKYTPSADTKQAYSSNPLLNNQLYGSVTKNLQQNEIIKKTEEIENNTQTTNRLLNKQNTFSMTSNMFNGSKKEFNMVTQQSIENIQIMKPQQMVSRSSLTNQNQIPITNNYMVSSRKSDM